MEKFTAKHPDVLLEVVYINSIDNPIALLLDNTFDIYVVTTYAKYDVEDVANTPVSQNPSHCLVTKLHPLAKNATASLADVAQYKVGINKLKRKMDIIQVLQAINPSVDIVEGGGVETKFIYNLCFTGGVYISKTYFVTNLSSLVAVPIEPDFPDYISVFYRQDPSDILAEFVDHVKEMYIEDGHSQEG